MPPNKERFGYDLDSRGARVELGSGSSGITYRGWIKTSNDPGSETSDGEERTMRVALKHFSFIATDTRSERSHEGRREFLDFGRLRHRNIVEHLRFFYDNHRPIIATRFIDGKNLHQMTSEVVDRQENGSQEWIRRVLGWTHDLCGALQYLDACQIVHRDIKPSNIVVQRADDRPILIDFGVGKNNVKRRSPVQSTLGNGVFVGTLQFAAPEQFVGESSPLTNDTGAVTGRADVYALAVTLAYALVPSCVPDLEFRGLSEHTSRLPRFEMLPEIPGLERLLRDMTSIDPGQRPSAREASDRLRKIREKEFNDKPSADDTGAIPPPPPANNLPEFVPIGHEVDMARALLSQHTALYYSERHHDSLELDASSRTARRSYEGALDLIETINRESSDLGYRYRLPTLDEWRLGAGISEAGMLAANEAQCMFEQPSDEMEWLDKKSSCVFPECRRVAYLCHGEPQDTERHQSWPKGAIRLVREPNISI